jgi:ankyrin repeat protein
MQTYKKILNFITIILVLTNASTIAATSFNQLVEAIKNKDLGAAKKILDAEPKLISEKYKVYAHTGYTPLMLAISGAKKKEADLRDLELIKLLLTYKQDLNVKDDVGNTALVAAALRQRKDIVKLLLDAGADRSTPTGAHVETAYDRIQGRGLDEIANLLKPPAPTIQQPEAKAAATPIKQPLPTQIPTPVVVSTPTTQTSAAFNQLNEAFLAAFHQEGAINANILPLVYKILDEDSNVAHEKDDAGNTLLNTATRFMADPAIINALLQYGADVNTQNHFGETPLMEIASGTTSGRNPIKKASLLNLLLQAGADPMLKNRSNETALSKALEGPKDQHIIKLLQDYMAMDPKVRATNGVLRNLRSAILAKKPKAVAVLLQKNPQLNVNAKDRDDQTLLMHATALHVQNIDIVQLLLNAGADVNITDKDGKTAYDLIQQYEQHNPNLKAIIDLLRAAGKPKSAHVTPYEPASGATNIAVGNELALLANQLTALAIQTK